ncbi:hypothetical protein GCM10010994_14270 [Chelatococcus reniformis]|uniref:Uncharacterized protein n=1 Tax=Chelatococcus reniformis TaxID=1494448 RepID=A0A916XA84_9HYPH|nr:hypothetical protein GCM10010994_14270 [Chelatococcus reniformis]
MAADGARVDCRSPTVARRLTLARASPGSGRFDRQTDKALSAVPAAQDLVDPIGSAGDDTNAVTRATPSLWLHIIVPLEARIAALPKASFQPPIG